MRNSNFSWQTRSLLLGGAVCITLLIFLFLPVSYYIFHKELFEALASKKRNSVKVESVSLKKPEKKKIRPIRKKKQRQDLTERNFTSRFDLDLSVQGPGDGSGGISAGEGKVIDENEADMPPIKMGAVPPEYPDRARSAGVEGRVSVKLLINEKGEVEKVVVLDCPRGWGFEEAVTEALSRWRFEPARLENLPVKVWAKQEIVFQL